jgi:hypothetical protein
MPTRKQIVDSVLILATRFSQSDEQRLDEDYLANLVELTRVSEILKEYDRTGVIDQNWLMDFGIYSLTKVNFADDPNITFLDCDVMKTVIPEVMNLTALGDGNLDLALRIMSASGKTSYTFSPIERWHLIPKEHVQSKFGFYQRFGTTIYVNKLVNNLRFFGIPATTEGLMIKKTFPVISGSIKSGVVYQVKGTSGTVTYNGVIYIPGDTFTGIVSITTFTASGTSQVFYNNYEVAMTENDPYPVSAHLMKQIVISILTTELQIERQQATDIVNDSADDVLKQQ